MPLTLLLVSFLFILTACLIILTVKYIKVTQSIVTKEKEIEETSKILIGKNVELFDQNVRQQKLLESRGDFIAIVAHQLRTPATEVKWGIGELRSSPHWPLSEPQKEYVEHLYASAEWMVHLIDKLVKLVNIEQVAGALLVTPYAYDTIVRETALQVKDTFPTKKITLDFDLRYADTIASIDTDSLKMIITNLVENAFHYSKDDGRITVRTKLDAEKNIYTSIEDTGMGIPSAKQKTIFIKFQRAEGAITANAKGMGLGLYIVKKIIEQHRGTIGFTTEEGVGTTFYFTLPTK